jgi:chemotaxis methyl-accepting protein methylase
MKQNYGIDLTQKKVIINGRLDNYLKKSGYATCTEYLDSIRKDKTGTLEKMLVNLLTTNHTYFMREFEHFEFFRKEVLPWLKTKEDKTKNLRIWCGAASTGEEPYMILPIFLEWTEKAGIQEYWRQIYQQGYCSRRWQEYTLRSSLKTFRISGKSIFSSPLPEEVSFR